MKYSFEEADLEHFPDYYEVLGLDIDATTDDIQEMYRKLASSFHPDKNKSKYSTKKMMEINEAYDVLRDKMLRKKYDKLLLEMFDDNGTASSMPVDSQEATDDCISYLNNYLDFLNDPSDSKEIIKVRAAIRDLTSLKIRKKSMSQDDIAQVKFLLEGFISDARFDTNYKNNQSIYEHITGICDALWDSMDDNHKEAYNQSIYQYNKIQVRHNRWWKFKKWFENNVWSWAVFPIIIILTAVGFSLLFKYVF